MPSIPSELNQQQYTDLLIENELNLCQKQGSRDTHKLALDLEPEVPPGQDPKLRSTEIKTIIVITLTMNLQDLTVPWRLTNGQRSQARRNKYQSTYLTKHTQYNNSINSKHDKFKEIQTYTYHKQKVIRQRQREHFESTKGEATYHKQGILNKVNS